MPRLERAGDVYLLSLGDRENRLNPDWADSLNDLLDQVVAAGDARALVTHSTGKFWSSGLDLDWFQANLDSADQFLHDVQVLIARVLTLPVPTVAAITGHAFAAGAMLACAHDYAVMREDRGYWCLPEVTLGLQFTPGMDALLQARMPRRTSHDAMVTGRRYTGPEALGAGIVDAVAPADRILEAATNVAASRATQASTILGQIKSQMYTDVLIELRDRPATFPRRQLS